MCVGVCVCERERERERERKRKRFLFAERQEIEEIRNENLFLTRGGSFGQKWVLRKKFSIIEFRQFPAEKIGFPQKNKLFIILNWAFSCLFV